VTPPARGKADELWVTWPEPQRAPTLDPDEHAAWFASVEDKLVEAEELYRVLVETLPLATYIDRDDRETGTSWISAQIEAITSYSAAEWTANPDLLGEVLHPDDKERVLAEMKRVKESGGSRDDEYRMVRRDGTVVWVHDTAVTVIEGSRRYARGFVVDVTARREAELELERQNDQLRQLDRLKDEFVALVSHELRTPLTSIRGYLELLLAGEAGDLTDEQRQFLGVVERNAHRLLALVGDLLFLAQVEAGRLALELGAVDLDSIAAECVETARPLAEEKGVTLTLATGPVPLVVGDRARLSQLLDNLVSNGIKFTPSGGRVDVRIRGLRGKAVIEVRDTGMGIPATEQEHLFERFFRTSKATEQAIPGTGLGLAISKAIVEAHGGGIVVASDDDAGSTFRISLPVGQAQSAPPEVEEVAL
jgi:PAS domain S-box-containing protein